MTLVQRPALVTDRMRAVPPVLLAVLVAAVLHLLWWQFIATSGGDIGSTVGRTATSLGGELAAAQFNALLKGIAPLKGLSTRFGSTDAGGVKTSLVYEVGDTLSAVATYEGGAPSGSPGSSTTSGGTSTTAPGASVSIDWRFYKNWLIRASVGTSADIPKGEVDLLWQYRY